MGVLPIGAVAVGHGCIGGYELGLQPLGRHNRARAGERRSRCPDGKVRAVQQDKVCLLDLGDLRYARPPKRWVATFLDWHSDHYMLAAENSGEISEDAVNSDDAERFGCCHSGQ